MSLYQIYDKYKDRLDETQKAWDDAYNELRNSTDRERKNYLTEHIQLLNAQISAYECIVKDLKEYLDNANEISR